MNEVKPGDVVELMSGSPRFTVESVDRKGVAHCVRWVEATPGYTEGIGKLTIPAAALRVVEEDK